MRLALWLLVSALGALGSSCKDQSKGSGAPAANGASSTAVATGTVASGGNTSASGGTPFLAPTGQQLLGACIFADASGSMMDCSEVYGPASRQAAFQNGCLNPTTLPSGNYNQILAATVPSHEQQLWGLPRYVRSHVD